MILFAFTMMSFKMSKSILIFLIYNNCILTMLIIYLQVQTFKMHWQKPIIQVRDREREREREFERSSLHGIWVTACSPVIDSILCRRLLYILSITITQEVTYVLVTTGNQYTTHTAIIGKQKCKKCFVLNMSHDSFYHVGLICKKLFHGLFIWKLF